MKRSVQVYIDFNKELKRIELFNDENIDVTSSVQNISDISKVFTDFSQSFTIPASTYNNNLFQHFYNSDFDGTVDHQLRRPASIEIDLIPFRTGMIQLEKSNLKDGHVYSYTITFYGDIRTLKDAFGEQKLSQLNFNEYPFEYTGANIQNTITDGSDLDIRFPLISSKRLWQYANPTVVFDNIDEATDSIKFSELFPAIKVKAIFDILQTTFGVTFQGVFLSNKKFTNAFLYLKNRELCTFLSAGEQLDLLSVTYQDPAAIAWTQVDLVNNTIHYSSANMYGVGYVTIPYMTTIAIQNVSILTAIYYIDIYVNNALYNTITGIGNNTYTAITDSNNPGVDKTIYFVIRSATPMTFGSIVTLYTDYNAYNAVVGGSSPVVDAITIIGANQTATSFLDMATFMPDIKIADFFSGVLKEMNLTCYSLAKNIFQIEPLEDWYNKGAIYDLTTSTIIDEIEISRVPLYKNINFKHAKSQSFMNETFFNFFNREYGDLTYSYPYDGSDYNIEVPFENLMFNKFDNQLLQVGYCLTKEPDFKPYVPKPIILYLYDGVSISPFYFNDAVSDNVIDKYMPFGQDVLYLGQDYSLNFGEETSTLLLSNISNSLFQTYYFGYLSNLYQRKNRITGLKMNMPLSILTKLRLNDRLVIRDKRYIINEMKSSLTSGIVNLTLINDFRPIRRTKPIKGDKGGGAGINVAVGTILLPNNAFRAEIDITGSGILSVDYPTIIEDTVVTFTIPELPSTYTRITEDGLNRRVTEGMVRRITEESKDTFIYIAKITYFFENDYTETQDIQIVQ